MGEIRFDWKQNLEFTLISFIVMDLSDLRILILFERLLCCQPTRLGLKESLAQVEYTRGCVCL